LDFLPTSEYAYFWPSREWFNGWIHREGQYPLLCYILAHWRNKMSQIMWQRGVSCQLFILQSENVKNLLLFQDRGNGNVVALGRTIP
jgi:hypothetical protein